MAEKDIKLDEEVTEAVATQSPSTDQGIDDKPTASDELSEKLEDGKIEAKAEDSTEAKAEDSADAKTEEATAEPEEEEDEDEEISYHAVEKEGDVTAIWEMQGQKHIRTISPRSTEGLKILNLFTSEIHETDAPSMAESA